MSRILSMETATVAITAITTYPGNARKGDMAALESSLNTHGQYRPLVVQRSTGHVLAGNNTLAAAKALGWDQIAVQYVDVDDDTARRILLADNRTNDGASYDETALARLLEDLDGLDGTGFTDEEFDDLLASLEEVSEETFFTGPPPPPPTTNNPTTPTPSSALPSAGHHPDPDTGRKSSPIDANTSTYRSLNDLHDQYQGTDRRSLQLVYRGADFVWMVQQLDELAATYGTDNNADTVARLVADATGTTRPTPREEPA